MPIPTPIHDTMRYTRSMRKADHYRDALLARLLIKLRKQSPAERYAGSPLDITIGWLQLGHFIYLHEMNNLAMDD